MILHIRKPTISLKEIGLCDIAFIIYFAYPTFNLAFSAIFAHMPFNGDQVLRAVLVLLAVIGLIINYRNNKRDIMFVYAFIILIFLLSVLLNPELIPWIKDEYWGAFFRVFRIDRGIYAFLFVRLVGNEHRIKRDLRSCMYLLLIYIYYMALKRIGLGYWELLNNDGITISHSLANMAFGYLCAFDAILFFTFSESNKRIIEIAFGVLSAILAVTLGSRGSIIVIASYILIILIIRFQSDFTLKKFVLVLTIAAIAVLGYLYYDKIVFGIQMILSNIGIESRNLSALISGSLTDSNGRDRIAKLSIEGIRETFPFGNGAYGDRPYVGQFVRWGYSHNIILELVCSFGLLGIFFLIWFELIWLI